MKTVGMSKKAEAKKRKLPIDAQPNEEVRRVPVKKLDTKPFVPAVPKIGDPVLYVGMRGVYMPAWIVEVDKPPWAHVGVLVKWGGGGKGNVSVVKARYSEKNEEHTWSFPHERGALSVMETQRVEEWVAWWIKTKPTAKVLTVKKPNPPKKANGLARGFTAPTEADRQVAKKVVSTLVKPKRAPARKVAPKGKRR